MALTNELLAQMSGLPVGISTNAHLRALAGTSDPGLLSDDLLRIAARVSDPALDFNGILRAYLGPGYDAALTNEMLAAVVAGGGGFALPGFPSAAYVLQHDYVSNLYRGPPIAVTRAGSAYVEDTTGAWTLCPPDTPRRSDKGLLVEGSQTNSIRNNALQGMVPGSPGTLPTNHSLTIPAGTTRTLSTETIGGVEYLRIRIQGTVSADGPIQYRPEPPNGVAAVTGQLWAQSAFFQFISTTGTSPFLIEIWEYNAAVGFLASGTPTTIPVSILAQPVRYAYSRTLSQATTAFVAPIVRTNTLTAGTVLDVEFRIGWPQLEQWSTGVTTIGGASSPIRTAGAAATRQADQVVAVLPSGLSAWTLSASALTPAFPLSTAPIATLNDGTASNLACVRYDAPVTQTLGVSTKAGAQSAASPTIGVTAAGTIFGVAYSQVGASGAAAISLNGSTPSGGALATSTQSPTGLTKLQIGCSGLVGPPYWGGYIRRVSVLPSSVPNAQLALYSVLG